VAAYPNYRVPGSVLRRSLTALVNTPDTNETHSIPGPSVNDEDQTDDVGNTDPQEHHSSAASDESDWFSIDDDDDSREGSPSSTGFI